MNKKLRAQPRSGLSDLLPDPGPGAILTLRSQNSLRRCYREAVELFFLKRSYFTKCNRSEVKEILRPNVLHHIVRWYWHLHDHEHRTKGSDLKHELTRVVTHLKPLVEAMGEIHPKTRGVLNQMMVPPDMVESCQHDVFSDIEQLNKRLLETCDPLVKPKFIKRPTDTLDKSCEALLRLWERISKTEFQRNTKIGSSRPGRSLTKDKFEFESDGMHFVHVLLQAIDPKITYSQVRTSVRRIAGRAPKNAIDQSPDL